MVSVPVRAVTAIPIIAIAPIGSGFRIMPTIVATKIANKCQALGSTPAGAGMSQIPAVRSEEGANTGRCGWTF